MSENGGSVGAREAKAVEEANARLRAGKIGLSIIITGNKLYLKGMMPDPKNPGKRKRRELALKINANLAGIQAAEEEARRASFQIARGQQPVFTFRATKAGPEERTLKDWIESWESAYRKRRGDQFNAKTWEKDYLFVYRKLDFGRTWDDDYLVEFVERQTKPATRSRVRFVNAIRALAKHAGRNLELEGMARGYEAAKVPRILPDDEEILKIYEKILDVRLPDWAWVFGTIATYGLRPHEIYRLDWSKLEKGEKKSVRILEHSKTGDREIWPVWPEWIDKFNLREPMLPPYKGDRGDDNQILGHKVILKFKRDIGVPFPLYNLRHKYAVRCIAFGVSDTMAARWMGHSVEVHRKTYQRWLSSRDQEQEFERLETHRVQA